MKRKEEREETKNELKQKKSYTHKEKENIKRGKGKIPMRQKTLKY